MSPDDIPTAVTELTYTAPWIELSPGNGFKLSQNDVAKAIAHFWPAIEQQIRQQIAEQLETCNPDCPADFSDGVDWAINAVRNPA